MVLMSHPFVIYPIREIRLIRGIRVNLIKV